MRTLSFTRSHKNLRHAGARQLPRELRAVLALVSAAAVALLGGRGWMAWLFVLVTGSVLSVLVLAHTRVERASKARLAESARREGAALTARAVRHHLGNKLAI